MEKLTKTHRGRLRKQRETFTKPLEEVRKKNNIAKTMAIVKILSSKTVYKKKGRLPQNRGKSSEKQHRGNHEKPTKTERTFEKTTRDLNKNLRKRSAKQHRRIHGHHEKS